MGKEESLHRLFNPKRNRLPSLPVLFVELKKLLDNPFTSNRKISDLIKKDQGMVAQIMQLSNSPLYGKRQEIKRIENALTYLGNATLRNMILQVCLVRMFPLKSIQLPDFSAQLFWRHALGTGYFAEQLAMMLRLQQSEEYYLGGLLHDLGKVLLFQYHPDRYEEAILLSIKENLTSIEAEKRIFEVDHADIGAYLAESWSFETDLIRIIGNHHKLLPSRMNLSTAIVNLANHFANLCGLGLPWDAIAFHDITTLPAWQWIENNQQLMGLEPDALLFELSQHVEEIASSVDILLNHSGAHHG